MKANLKKTLVLLLCALTLAHCFPAFVSAAPASGTCGEGVVWSLDGDGVLTVSGSGEMNGDWYSNVLNRTAVRRAVIENGVTGVGDRAFEQCGNLTSVTIPESVTRIGSCAFSYCRGLTSVAIPKSVTEIGKNAFSFCSNLTSVALSARLTAIGDYTFYHCTSLTSVTLPDGVTDVRECAFCSCESLASVTLPDSLKRIGRGAFQRCGALVSVTLPDGMTEIGDHAFAECAALTSIEIPDGVTDVAYMTFSGCGSLASVELPNGLKSIGESAFSDCKSLTAIELPDSLQSVGDGAFGGCRSLSAIRIPDGVTDIGPYTFSGCADLTSVELPDGVTGVGVQAFQGCASLASIALPNGVTSIGDQAFDRCASLASIELPGSVTEIGMETFFNCASLASVTLPNGLTKIGYEAFACCASLASIVIPESVTEVEHRAFSGCTALASIEVSAGNPKYHAAGNCLIDTAAKRVIAGCPNSVIPADDSVYSIGNSAFYNCALLTSIAIPNNVTYIDDWAFGDCGKLTKILLPSKVNRIGKGAFSRCAALKDVYYAGTEGRWKSIRVESGNEPLKNAAVHYRAAAFDAPTDLSVLPTAEKTLTLSWSAVENAARYNVYRYSEAEKAYVRVGASDTAGYVDGGLTVGQRYSYKVRAVWAQDGVTREGSFSADVSATALGTPAAPTDLTVTRTGETALTLCWKMVPGATQYNVYRSGEAQSGYVYLGTSKEIKYVDTGLTVGETCYYKVLAAAKGNGLTFAGPLSEPATGTVTGEISAIHTGCCGDAAVWSFDPVTGELTVSGTGELYGADPDPNVGSVQMPWSYLREQVTSLTVEEGITKLPRWAFKGFTALKAVKLADSITDLGDLSFSGCSALESVNLPKSLTRLYCTFSDCSSLTGEMAIPDNVTVMVTPFRETGVTTVILPKNMRVLTEGAFEDTVSVDTIWAPVGLDEIQSHAFCRSGIVCLIIPDGVKKLGSEMCLSCGSLTTVILPDGIGEIPFNCFGGGNKALKYVRLPSDLEKIGTYAFNGSGLERITVPASVTQIGEHAFDCCESLTDVYFTGTEAQWNAVAIDPSGNDALLNARMHFEAPAEPGFRSGDADGDGVITAGDARTILRAAVGLEPYAQGTVRALNFDFDMDGAVTAGDARLTLRAAVGLKD